jgi:hypothetical protein
MAALVPTPGCLVIHLDMLDALSSSPVPIVGLLEPDGIVLVVGAVLAVDVLAADVLAADVLFADRVSEAVVGIVPVPLIEVVIAAVLITESASVVNKLVKIASCEVAPSASVEELCTCRASYCAVPT